MTDYLDWQSDLSVEAVFAGNASISYPELWHNGLIYLSVLKEQQGRVVLIYQQGQQRHCLTPQPYSLRTRISEYGGKPFWIQGNHVYFVNDDDQNIYRQQLDAESASAPEQITKNVAGQGLAMFTDLWQVSEHRLLSILELEGGEAARENQHCICTIDTSTVPATPQILLRGADFYSNLVFDQAHQRLAWVQWQHPNMPWDETELWLADLSFDNAEPDVVRARKVPLTDQASVCQLYFANNGTLFFSADFANQANSDNRNFWNVYALDPNQSDLNFQAVTAGGLEFGYPHWQYGDSRIIQYDENSLLTIASKATEDVLVQIEVDSLATEAWPVTGFTLQNLSGNGAGKAAAVCLSSHSAPDVVIISENGRQLDLVNQESAILSSEDVSVALHIEYATRDGGSAFGFYYAPKNSAYPSPQTPPPLLVMVHGGPTARAYGFFDLQKQFWTQRGFAVLDVNHRGSSGYGRAFRDALYGEWGELDISDIADGVNHLVEQGLADPERVCIRGKSAGGYAVLCALTQYPQLFAAGASYYGIGNLVTLAETTHKFEKHYADRMVGEVFSAQTSHQPESRFYQRSPINRLSELRSSMIVFQGLQDKIVPPAVAHEIIDVLQELGLEYSYTEYDDEGHGFRQLANNIDAWTRELAFYRKSLKNEPD
ncbi:MAG: prolyl oligopeptidase family serine peptidase [Pseudomonadota bacterium]